MKRTVKNCKSLYFILLLIVWCGGCTFDEDSFFHGCDKRGARLAAVSTLPPSEPDKGGGGEPGDELGSYLTGPPEQSPPLLGLTEIEFSFFGDFDPVVQHRNAEIDSAGVAVAPATVAADRLHSRSSPSPRVYFTNRLDNQVVVFDTATRSLIASRSLWAPARQASLLRPMASLST